MSKRIRYIFLVIATALTMFFGDGYGIMEEAHKGNIDYSNVQSVWIKLGAANKEHGIRQIFSESTKPLFIKGKECRYFSKGKGICLDIDDSFIFDGNWPRVDVTIEYYDQKRDGIRLSYDRQDSSPHYVEYEVSKTDTGKWKRYMFRLDDVSFSNRINEKGRLIEKGGDLSIHNMHWKDWSKEYISYVEVSIPYLTITAPKEGNIFEPGEKVVLEVKIASREERIFKAELEYRITDINGRVVQSDNLGIGVKHGVNTVNIDVGADKRGFFYSWFFLKAGEKVLGEETVSFAVFPKNSPKYGETSPFGICTRLESPLRESMAKLLAEAGISWVRQEFLWSSIEPREGEFHWEDYDAAVGVARKYGLKIYGLFFGESGWNKDITTGGSEGIRQFANYVSKVVNRYKDEIKYWEIWCEEDGRWFWKDPSPKNYVALLKEVYKTVKNVEPTCKIILGGLAAYNSQWGWWFLRGVYENGGKDYFDVLAIHPYADSEDDLENMIERAATAMNRHSDRNKEVWITEIGISTFEGGGKTSKQQASFLIKSYVVALSHPQVKKMFWYRFQNRGTDPRHEQHNYGVLNHDFSSKPAYVAYRTLVDQLKGMVFDHRLDLGERVYAYKFIRGKDWVIILWSDNNMEIEMNLDEETYQIHLVDMVGNMKKVRSGGGKVKLTLNKNPMFLVINSK